MNAKEIKKAARYLEFVKESKELIRFVKKARKAIKAKETSIIYPERRFNKSLQEYCEASDFHVEPTAFNHTVTDVHGTRTIALKEVKITFSKPFEHVKEGDETHPLMVLSYDGKELC